MNVQPGSRREFLVDGQGPWNRPKAEAAMDALGQLIHAFHGSHWRLGFQVLTCLIDLDDYRQARETNPLLRSAHAICVDTCVGRLLLDEDGLGVLYFDRGEGFMKEVEQVWRRDRRKSHVEWTRQIRAITQVDSRDAWPLQAADLLAWSTNQGALRATERGIPRASFFGRTHYYYDLEEIEREFTPEKERLRIEGERRNKRKTPQTRALDQEAKSEGGQGV